MDTRLIYTGSHGEYDWLTSSEDYSGTLLQLCPEIVVGRYVAVTCVDGGPFRLSESKMSAGWTSILDIAYSPIVKSSAELPHQVDGPDGPGYDEFYVFESPRDLGQRMQSNIFEERFAPAPGRTAVFVTWGAFRLHDPNPGAQTLLNLFWPQLERLCPQSYVADGTDCLTFVSRKRELVELLHQRLAGAPLNAVQNGSAG